MCISLFVLFFSLIGIYYFFNYSIEMIYLFFFLLQQTNYCFIETVYRFFLIAQKHSYFNYLFQLIKAKYLGLPLSLF
jgi:hypothetical protein